MNQILDNIYSYNRKLFRNIPLSSILFGLITILIFTKPQLIGEININMRMTKRKLNIDILLY
ncbi:hypothetical protein SEVCU028_0608 [Staphylococcus epidermidis VCU028]|nr:hypothetical protein SEVCU028_0608 [Staphylococcus epidermidis VCU028]EHQ81488.1 hypothetical protein SEVCU081_1886 [Staphylococcus epidermidis VCU081]